MGAARSVLPTAVANFLIQFSIYLHQQATYPSGHPILTSSASATAMRLGALLLDRETFAMGVAGDRLVIDGTSTDPSNAVLRELAEQLHRQQIGVVRFWRGVGPHELEDLVTAMAQARTADRPGGIAKEDVQRWAHIRLERHGYEQLLLAGDEGPGYGSLSRDEAGEHASPAVRLWTALASNALTADTSAGTTPVQDIARAIEERKDDAQYDRVIVGYLLQLGRETSRAEAADGAAIGARFQELLHTVSPEALRQLLHLGATLDQRRELMDIAARDLPVQTVLLILNAAAAESGQTISHTLLRLLGKLARQAEDGPVQVRPAAEAAVRDCVRRLLDQWKLEDPNPSSHTGVLDRLARSASPVDSAAQAPGSSSTRIVQMSLEVATAGPMLQAGISDMLARGKVATLLDLLRAAPESVATLAAWDHLATPGALEQLLLSEEIDAPAIEGIISRLGDRAAAPMIDALSAAGSRSVRRRLLTWLGHLGPSIGPLVVERLHNAPWYVQRNLLGLLGVMPSLPPGFAPLPFAAHTDSRVRREAFKILFRDPALYEDAVLRAIRDEDPQIVAFGLTVAVDNFPAAAGPALLAAIYRREWPAELRVQAIRALALSSSPQVGRWLVEQTLTRRRWFRRPKLVARTPELLAALSVLAANWSHEHQAAEALRLAQASRDEGIRHAALRQGMP